MRERDTAIRENPLVPVAETGWETDADRSAEAVRQAIEFRAALADLNSDVEDPVRFKSATSVLASASGGTTLDALQAYLSAGAVADDKARQFTQKDGVFPVGLSVADLEAGLATVVAERARLGDWAKWVKKSKEVLAAGLGSLVEALEDGQIVEDAEEAFEQAYAAWWLPLAMDASDELRRFTHWDHENAIATFCKLDDAAAELAPVEVMRRIAHGLPAKDGVPRKSELGTLRYQLGLVRPSMPIRQLLASLPETFGKLAPCVLMSPLSVAQYLPADQATFDVVIFDEASQITTWDAIGAIARGRQTIIVGDPKQLPPTNFFGRADDEDGDLPEVERDMPSILDEVSAAGVPHRNLNWHYRSRDEALIAFSNHFYYEGGLVTFPAPSTGSDAIKFHKVNGTYARGRGRVNEEEAKAIAEVVKRRLKTWLAIPEDQRYTLGVITFNAEQQSLILDLLDEVRRGNSELEWFFADEREEPIIVKNLENIQGDERDVMLFSVTFGPDLAGKLTMNFGAINGMGGEKRLNVAITPCLRGRIRRQLLRIQAEAFQRIDKSTSCMRPACQMHQSLLAHHRRVAAVAVGMQCPGEPREQPFGHLPRAGRVVVEQHDGRLGAGAHLRPELRFRFRRLAGFFEHLHRGLVHQQLGPLEEFVAQHVDERHHELARAHLRAHSRNCGRSERSTGSPWASHQRSPTICRGIFVRAQVAMRRGQELRCQRRQAATPLAGLAVAAATIAAVVISGHGQALGAEAWNGLTIAPEHRCSPYDSDDYYYSRSVEAEIVAAMDGKIYGPYTGRQFGSTRETDIEHIVARSEAHDSGLCAAGPEVRWRFASDLLNLTLAAPEVNRCWSSGKCAHDAAEWLPPMNKCWFAARVVAVKRKYALTVDRPRG